MSDRKRVRASDPCVEVRLRRSTSRAAACCRGLLSAGASLRPAISDDCGSTQRIRAPRLLDDLRHVTTPVVASLASGPGIARIGCSIVTPGRLKRNVRGFSGLVVTTNVVTAPGPVAFAISQNPKSRGNSGALPPPRRGRRAARDVRCVRRSLQWPSAFPYAEAIVRIVPIRDSDEEASGGLSSSRGSLYSSTACSTGRATAQPGKVRLARAVGRTIGAARRVLRRPRVERVLIHE